MIINATKKRGKPDIVDDESVSVMSTATDNTQLRRSRRLVVKAKVSLKSPKKKAASNAAKAKNRATNEKFPMA